MTWQTKTLLGLIALSILALSSTAYGMPSGGEYPPRFTLRHGDWYDSWGINRNFDGGSDGYLPNLAYETLGADRELAFSLGEWFKATYPQRVERAKAILAYVQKWTDYGYDDENVFMNGVAQEEWAWNADEMAHMIDTHTGIVAIGYCEDMSFLCSTIYLAAGFDVAIASPTGHVALLIWLPEYGNANHYWDLPDDGREHGWIWVEATGEKNPLGWTPSDFSDGYWDYYILGFTMFNVELFPEHPKAGEDVSVEAAIVSARGSVDEVLLDYTVQGVSDSKPMAAKGSVYGAVIPRQPDGTRVVYTVSATSSDGFERVNEYEYVVGEAGILQIPPFLTETAVLFVILFILAAVLSRTRL